jgi:D-alanine transaminase
MMRQAYVNGRYVPHAAAMVHIEDRGYQFADGVYEVIPVYHSILVDEGPHLDRLERSLRELAIAPPLSSRRALELVARELIRRNGLKTGILYMQVTRGVAPRDHGFPRGVRPSLVMTTKVMRPHAERLLTEGLKVITVPDQRWARCDIKSIALLPNVLAKQAAHEAGAYEAWQVDAHGHVTEGTSTNAWIVTKDDRLVTRDTSANILSGITRLSLMELARSQDLTLEERAFTVEEAREAREAFLTSSTSYVLPVTRIDDQVIGDGKPGALTMKLREIYVGYMDGLGECR